MSPQGCRDGAKRGYDSQPRELECLCTNPEPLPRSGLESILEHCECVQGPQHRDFQIVGDLHPHLVSASAQSSYG